MDNFSPMNKKKMNKKQIIFDIIEKNFDYFDEIGLIHMIEEN